MPIAHSGAKRKCKEWKPLGHFPLWRCHPSLPRTVSYTTCWRTGKPAKTDTQSRRFFETEVSQGVGRSDQCLRTLRLTSD